MASLPVLIGALWLVRSSDHLQAVTQMELELL